MFSVTKTGMKSLPLCTWKVRPTNSGVIMERLDQVCGEDFSRASQDILFFQPHDFQQQDEAIKKARSLCESEVDVGLIVVDSMTIFYRVNLGTGSSPESRMLLGKQANMLLNIAREFEVPVVITAQVYQDPETNMMHAVGGHFQKHQAKAIIRLEKLPHGNRRARIVKHRSIPSGREAMFQITDTGFCTIGENGDDEEEYDAE